MTKYINPSQIWDTYTGELKIVSDDLSETLSLKAPASYIIYKDGDVVKAKNGKTGVIEFSGANATTVIQNVINALESGGKILVKRGEYVISSAIVISKNRIMLCGEGDGTVLKVADNSNVTPIKINNTSYVVIRDLKIDGNRDNQTEEAHGIYIYESTHCRVERVTITNVKGTGVIVAGSANYNAYCDIIGNRIINMDGLGIYGQRGRHLRVIGNYVEKTGDCGISVIHETLVAFNHIYDVAAYYGITTSGTKVRVIGNLIASKDYSRSTASHGIVISGAETAVVGNSVWFCGESGIVVQNDKVLVASNCVNGNSKHGIWLTTGAYDCLVVGNEVSDNSEAADDTYDGIYLDGDASRNIIIGNIARCLLPTWKQRYGINISDASCEDNLVLYNNVIENSVGPINDAGTRTIIEGNIGYTTENSGTATITAGNTSVTVNHGLVSTPSKVLVTPTGDPGDRYWVANITSTSFDIMVATAPSTDVDFYWEAEV